MNWEQLGVTRVVVDRSKIDVEGSDLGLRIESLRQRGYSEEEIEELVPKLIEAERVNAALTKTPYADEPWTNPHVSAYPPPAVNLVEYVDVNSQEEADALQIELENPFE